MFIGKHIQTNCVLNRWTLQDGLFMWIQQKLLLWHISHQMIWFDQQKGVWGKCRGEVLNQQIWGKCRGVQRVATTRKVTFSCQSEAGRAPTLGHLTAVLLFFPSKPEQPTCMCHFCVWGIGSIHRSCSPPPQVYSASSCNVQLCTLFQPTMHHLPGDACTCDSEKHKVHTLAIKYAVCIL